MPMMTFSFRPTRWSTLPLIAASVRTLVVSWKKGSGQEPLHPDLQGCGCREVSGTAGKRDPLQPPDPRLPGACKAALRSQRAGRKRPLRAPEPSGRAVQVNQSSFPSGRNLPQRHLSPERAAAPCWRLLRNAAVRNCGPGQSKDAAYAYAKTKALCPKLISTLCLLPDASGRAESEIPKRPRGSLKAYFACVRSIRSARRYLAPPAA